MKTRMEQISGKLVNSDVSRVEDCSYTKPILSMKLHRTVAKGLKLLNQMLETVQLNNSCTNFPLLKQETELPHELLTYEIFARLPVKSLLRLKAVSKEWYSTVSSYEFANVHFKTGLSSYHLASAVECLFIQVASKFYLFHIQSEALVLDYCLVKLEPNFDNLEENDVRLVGSCNGLICLADSSSSSDYFYIWNPVNYQSRKFSDPGFVSHQCIVSWGFAYVASVDDYKVVKIVQDYNLMETTVFVFSLLSQEWKRVHDHGLDPSLSLTKTNPGVLVNDSLNWIMASRGPIVKRVVVRFSLTLEKFEEFSGLIPWGVTHLTVIGRCLSMYCMNGAEVSILKRPEEIETIRMSVGSEKWSCSGLVGSTRPGKCFIISKGSELALMDLDSMDKRRTPLLNLQQADKACMVSYVPSLISPFAIGELQKPRNDQVQLS